MFAGLPSAKSLAPGMRMHPNTPNVRMVDNFGGYTAARATPSWSATRCRRACKARRW